MSDNATPAVPAATPAAPVAAPPAAPAAPIPVVVAAPVAVPATPIAAPAVPPAPAAAQPPPAAPQPPAEPEPGAEPGWLKERLARAERAALKRLGVESEDEAKAALAAHKAKVEADKSLEQKRIEAEKKADAEAKRADGYFAILQGNAAAEMAKLQPDHRAAVIRLAGEDPAKQLDAITVLRPTWTVAPPPIPVAPAAAAPAAPAGETLTVVLPDGRTAQVLALAPAPAAPAPPPPAAPQGTQTTPPTQVSTAPPPGGPPAQAAQPTTLTEKLALLQQSNPTAAGYFVRQNAAALDRERASQAR